jgi:hypothetical protein
LRAATTPDATGALAELATRPLVNTPLIDFPLRCRCCALAHAVRVSYVGPGARDP